MPMIDVTAAVGTFADKRALTRALTTALMRWEKVPDTPFITDNSAAFVHELPADCLATANGDSTYVRVLVLTPVGILDRDQKLGVTREMTDLVVEAAGDPGLGGRVWVQVVEAPDGGWGIDGHAFTNAEIVQATRKELSGG
jgi:phenylpyruvate tautomerase PptA (4-oxalocrotonate tautomerase family)